MTVIGPDIFRRKQAEAQSSLNIFRVQQLRSLIRELWPAVTPEAAWYIQDAQKDMQQIHIFTMFMLDICGGTVTINLNDTSDEPPEIA